LLPEFDRYALLGTSLLVVGKRNPALLIRRALITDRDLT
jgi:hypothetical protein